MAGAGVGVLGDVGLEPDRYAARDWNLAPAGEGATLNNISQIHKSRGDYNTALRYLEQSLAIRQQIGDINGVAVTLSNMGAMLFEQERYKEAIPLLIQAYQIFKQIGSPNVQVPESYLSAIIERIGEEKFKEYAQN